MKVLVTGGTGLLGWWIVKKLLERGHEVYATYNTKEPLGLGDAVWIKLDLEDFDRIAQVMEDIRPGVVIHSAAYTDVDGCELYRDKAYRVNYLATKAIARACNAIDAYMIYISTDYVFDGEKGIYKEDDIPNPVNFYGLTKLLGEIAVQSALPERDSVVRVSGLYGYSPAGKRNFGINTLEKLLREEEVKAFRDQYLSPTYAVPLANNIVKMAEREVIGVFHIAGERMSRYEFALLLAEVMNVDRNLVKPISMNEVKLAAKRPRDSSLDTSRARSLKLEIPSQATCVKSFVELYRDLRSV